MLVADLRHFLDLPEDVPSSARALAEQLADIVRAGTAGDAGAPWESALPCRRRPGNRRCPGRMVVARTEPDHPIDWQCQVCGDAGTISHWADTPFDLRRRRPTLAGSVQPIVVAGDVAATLRDLRLLDPDDERLVFGLRGDGEAAVLIATADELAELIESVAAEANHEPGRARRGRLDDAFNALSTAAAILPGR